MRESACNKKLRVTEIPYDSVNNQVFYESIDDTMQKNWDVSQVRRNACTEMSRFPKHAHMWMEMIIPVQGSAEVYINNNRYIVNPGEMLIIPPLMIHESRRADFNKGYHGYVIHYYYRHLEAVIRNSGSLAYDTFPVPFEKKWMDHLESVISLLKANDPLYPLRTGLLMDEILLEVTEKYGHWDTGGLKDRQITLVQNARSAIFANAFKNQGIQEIVAELHVSYAYLSRCFKKETGITMSRYRDEIRMTKASQLIRKTNMPLEQVAMEVGYDEYAPFCRKFRSYYGYTPSSFRESGHK